MEHVDFSLLKKHPAAAGAVIIIGGLVAYFLIFWGKRASTNVATTGAPSPSDVQAGTALQFSQQQLQGAAQAQNAGLVALQTKSAADYAMADLSAKTSTVQQVNAISGQEFLQHDNNSTQLAVIHEQSQAEIQRAQIAANTQISTQQIATQGALALSANQTAANIATAQLMTAGNIAITSLNTQVQRDIAHYQSDTAIAQINAYSDVQKTGI